MIIDEGSSPYLKVLKLITSTKPLLPYSIYRELGHQYLSGLLLSLPHVPIPDPPISDLLEGETSGQEGVSRSSQ